MIIARIFFKTNWILIDFLKNSIGETLNHKKIIVRGTNWIGDAVMTFPAISAVKKIFPNSIVDVLARDWVLDIYRCHPDISRVIALKKIKSVKDLPYLFKCALKLREGRYDLAILFPNSFESALFFKISGIAKVYGYSRDFRRFLLNSPVTVPKEKSKKHEVFYYLNLVHELFPDGHALGKTTPKIDFRIDKSSIKKARRLLEDFGAKTDDLFIGLNPGAAYGPAKCWPKERFLELSRKILKEFPSSRIVVFGTKSESETGKTIKKIDTKRVIDLCGKTTLMEAISIISMLRIMITNDSGLMHVGAACGIPLVAIFGSTNPVTTGPWSEKAKIVRKELDCSPCLKRTCPRDFECMKMITVEDVFKEVKNLLNFN